VDDSDGSYERFTHPAGTVRVFVHGVVCVSSWEGLRIFLSILFSHERSENIAYWWE